MDEEQLYELWQQIDKFFSKDKENALISYLYYIYSNDLGDIDRFLDLAIDDMDDFIIDTIEKNKEMFE